MGDQIFSFPNQNKVGDVVSSVLTEAQFQKERGNTWVLMDGRDVSGSDFASVTGLSTLPDARGQFLRGKNNGRSDGQEDTAGERSLGDQQEDAAQRVKGTYVGSNLYTSFSGPSGTAQSSSGAFETAQFDAVRVPNGSGTSGVARGLNFDNAGESETQFKTDGDGTGTGENRPKNIAVNYFVKINK